MSLNFFTAEAGAAVWLTDGVDADGNDGNTMMKIIDKGNTGDLVVSGNGLFGGPEAVGTRTLKVQSSQAADIRVISGATHDASVIVQAGPDMDAKLVLVDPAAGFAGSKFEILNRGSAAAPTFEITDGENTMLTVTDRGATGDLDEGEAVLGNAVGVAQGVFGSNHWRTLVITAKAARLQHAQPGGAAAGKELLAATVARMAEVLGEGHQQTSKYREALREME